MMMMTIKVIENNIIVGDKSYALEKKLVKKLERVVRGVTQKNPKEDAVFINEGKEGKGKTNSSILEAVYLGCRTKREIHLFFRLEELMEFAKSTKEMIIIWDEPALDSLSKDQVNQRNVDMQRLFMTIRKKRHIFIINYTKFWKFPEYLVVDRSNGMVHMSEKEIGRFFYIRQKRLEFLWNEYRTKHKRVYLKAASFGGSMPNFMEENFNQLGLYVNKIKDATLADYEREKDEATRSIGVKDNKKAQERDHKVAIIRARIALSTLPLAQKAILLNINPRGVQQIAAEARANSQLLSEIGGRASFNG